MIRTQPSQAQPSTAPGNRDIPRWRARSGELGPPAHSSCRLSRDTDPTLLAAVRDTGRRESVSQTVHIVIAGGSARSERQKSQVGTGTSSDPSSRCSFFPSAPVLSSRNRLPFSCFPDMVPSFFFFFFFFLIPPTGFVSLGLSFKVVMHVPGVARCSRILLWQRICRKP